MFGVVSAILILWPYLYFGGFAVMMVFDIDSDVVTLSFLLLSTLLAFPLSALYARSARRVQDPVHLARKNMYAKFAAAPIDLAVAAFVILRSIENANAAEEGAMGIGLSIFVMLLFFVPYLLSRLVIHVSLWAVCKRIVKGKNRIFHLIAHAIPVADLISSAVLWYRMRFQPAQPGV